jgi:hypothetical protein
MSASTPASPKPKEDPAPIPSVPNAPRGRTEWPPHYDNPPEKKIA